MDEEVLEMTTATREKVDEIIAGWLTEPGNLDWDSAAGPLFLSSYAENDLTMTGGGGGDGSTTMTGCAECTGSLCHGLAVYCA